MPCFGPGTDPIFVVPVLLAVAATLFEKAQDSVVSNRIGIKFSTTVLQV